ncbi:DUF1003 domain-containing protein [Sphingomonas sp.]|uniref:DUF1003 domain-containing protein n=1 Tax=Sphingomonas sp. TaxID=28214 RepID=UPI0035C7B28F
MRDQPGMSDTLRENIARLSERAAAERAAAPLADRIAMRVSDFAGSMRFVLLHLVVYGAWFAVNLGLVPGIRPFDPTFVVLAMEASVEAIFLSTFVLITQNRMAREADRRADLDLHVNLLAEHELTRLAGLVEAIAERLEVPVNRGELAEIKKDVAPGAVLDALDAEKQD